MNILLNKLLDTPLTIDQKNVIKKHYLDLIVKQKMEIIIKEISDYINSITIEQLIENEEGF